MTLLDEVLQANKVYLEKLQDHTIVWNKYPQRQLAIVSCMDTRLVELLPSALGVQRGEVKIISTAGNTITDKFDDVIRSLLVCIYQFDIKEVMVIGHHGCGMATVTSTGLIEAMINRGINKNAIDKVRAELTTWIDTFHSPEDNIKTSVKSIHENPLIPKDIPVHGLIINPNNGKVDVVINGYAEI